MEVVGLQNALKLYVGKSFYNTLYLGFMYSAPASGDTTYDEPTAVSYSRICVNNRTQSSSSSINKFGDVKIVDGAAQVSNSERLFFNSTYNKNSTEASKIEPWVTPTDESKRFIKYLGVFSAATGGSCLDCVALTTPLKPGYEGDDDSPDAWTKKESIVTIHEGDLVIKFMNATSNS